VLVVFVVYSGVQHFVLSYVVYVLSAD